MGKPILGEHSRLEVIIEESCEFKVCEWLMEGFTQAVNQLSDMYILDYYYYYFRSLLGNLNQSFFVIIIVF